jgi:predicted DNA-binding protein with PD1-like motif
MENSTITVIDSNTYSKLTDPDSPFLLIVHRGENLAEVICECSKAVKLNSASLSGLGALENPTVAYYNLETQTYENKTFTGIYELISMDGNVGHDENGYVTHIHVALGDRSHNVIGGHLVDAVVGVTAEVTVTPFKGTFTRRMNCNLGLKLISV